MKDDETDLVVCPACEGRGHTVVIRWSGFVSLECVTCGGHKRVTREQAARYLLTEEE